ncbi:hypothetical protein Glove_417g49 [Diversispora epigaea]|uniref:Uncharacterized protein n=1 Tax=Diversispora epigaea TaxID=1348612 RepID=A0A397H1K3_9GLOM|nr:hypothetical protein Glove_417g49 [Diversispora epigaea]
MDTCLYYGYCASCCINNPSFENLTCSRNCLPGDYDEMWEVLIFTICKRRATEIIQRAFRSWMRTQTSSTETIQRAIIPWLYRFSETIMRNAMDRYYGIADRDDFV